MQPFLDQYERDANVKGLSERCKEIDALLMFISRCYDQVPDALGDFESWLGEMGRMASLETLAKQTVEFGYFLQEYTKSGFGKRPLSYRKRTQLTIAQLKVHSRTLSTI